MEALLRASAGLEPQRNFAWLALVRLLVQEKRLARADEALEEARAVGGISPAAYSVHRAFIALERNDPAAAKTALAQTSLAEARADETIRPVLDYVQARLGN